MNFKLSLAGALVATALVAQQPADAFLTKKGADEATVIKSGTTVNGKIGVTLDSGKCKDGDTFEMALKPGLFGKKAFKGCVLEGHVEGVQSAGKMSKKGAMNVVFDDIKTADGRVIPVEAMLASAPKPEGKFMRNAALVLGGAVAGHHIAKSKGAKHGALMGAVAGGAAALAMPGGNVVIKSGTELKVKFTKDLTL
jgi:hypothetical protein